MHMSATDLQNFDDPGLKAAVRRAWGGERAPLALRRRIIESLPEPVVDVQEHDSAVIRLLRWRIPTRGLVAAAIMLLAVGLIFRLWPAQARPAYSAIQLPTALADDLVDRHDACALSPDHHMPGIDRQNFPSIAHQLKDRLGFPILAASLPGSWKFHGASICPVGNTYAGHLMFERDGGKQAVSLFSLPLRFLEGTDVGCEYAQSDRRHPIAGWATSRAVYCVVGSSKDGSLTLDQMRTLRDQLQPELRNAISMGLATAQ